MKKDKWFMFSWITKTSSTGRRQCPRKSVATTVRCWPKHGVWLMLSPLASHRGPGRDAGRIFSEKCPAVTRTSALRTSSPAPSPSPHKLSQSALATISRGGAGCAQVLRCPGSVYTWSKHGWSSRKHIQDIKPNTKVSLKTCFGLCHCVMSCEMGTMLFYRVNEYMKP